jgi:ribosome-associated protein
VALDVGPTLAICDYFLICSGGSDRQVKTIAEEIEKQVGAAGEKPLRAEGSPDGGWVLIDYGVLVVHVFSAEMRQYYDLERLWKDAARPDISKFVGEAVH